MYNILEPRGYKLKCRGKINVKGKGSMVTYFLHRKQHAADDDDVLTHQSSRITQPSEDYELCDADDQLNMDMARLQEKRKSLCRQHHIFSSLTAKSVASEQSAAESIEFADDTAITSEKTRLLDRSNSKSTNTVVSPDISSKMLAKSNIPAHCAPLKDSIESLEKMLKNDYSLSDISSTKYHTIQGGIIKLSTESGDSLLSTNSFDGNQTLLINDYTATDGDTQNNDKIDEIDAEIKSQHSKASDSNLFSSIKNKFRFQSNGILKMSKSLYPFHRSQSKDIATAKMPNSKSLHYFPTHNQNGSVFL